LVEHRSPKPSVGGSSPSRRATAGFFVPIHFSYTVNISKFLSEVAGELKKASWPWESDPKIKGLKKYKELVDSTVVVLIAMVLLAGFVNFWDLFLTKALSLLTNWFTS
jgi:preprotein translocase subunit SecE